MPREKLTAQMSPPRMFNVRKDAMGSSYLTPTMATAAAVERYDQFLGRAAGEIAGLGNHISALICSLILFDTPFSLEDIPQMAAAALKSDAAEEYVHIHWARNRRLFCRELSVQTRNVLKQIACRDGIDISSAIADSAEIFSSWYPLPKLASQKSLLKWLINDASAWYYFNLPRPLFADLCHEQPITPLPPEVLARRLQQPRTPSELSPSQCRDNQSEDVLSEAITSSLLGVSHSSSSAWLVSALLEALKTNNNRESGPRKSTGRSKDAAIRSMSRLAGRLESADPATALIFDLALFMLNAGTARTTKGNVDTIRSYLDDLAKDLHAAISKARRHPLDLTDLEWHNQLINLRDAVPTSTRSKSIAALTKYLQSQLGIEAYLPKQGAIEQRAVHANVVWPNELSAAVDFLKTHEPDQRLQEQLPLMLWIGEHAPIRIGEVSLLQMRSVRVIEVKGIRHIELEIAPRLGLHAGKSTAARRVIPMGPAEECGVLMDWVDRRKTECADLEQFLFGDPHYPEKLYRLGRSISALNRTLKWASGDTSVSFHTLRHSVITRMVNQAFESADGNKATARLKEIALFSGHESVKTTLTCYFHAGHTALRRAIDRKLATRFPSPSNSPYKSADSTSPELAPQQLDKSEQSLSLISVIHETPLATQNQSMDLVQKILLDICNHLTPTAITSRCSISLTTLGDYVSCALDVTARLVGDRTTRKWDSDFESLEVKARLTKQRLDRLGFDFSQPELHVHQLIWSGLQKLNAVSVGEVGQSWLRSFEGGVISLENQSDFEPLIDFMKQAKVPAEHFLVRLASDPSTHVQKSEPPLKIQHLTHPSFGPETVTEHVAKRRGRPTKYLLVCRRPVFPGLIAPPAVCRMSEVHSAFLVCAISALHRKKRV